MGYPIKTGPVKTICGGSDLPLKASGATNTGCCCCGPCVGDKRAASSRKGVNGGGPCRAGPSFDEPGPSFSGGLGVSPPRPPANEANLVWSNGHFFGPPSAPGGWCGVGSFSGAAGGDKRFRSRSSAPYTGTEMPHGLLGDSPTLTSLSGLSKWLWRSWSSSGIASSSSVCEEVLTPFAQLSTRRLEVSSASLAASGC